MNRLITFLLIIVVEHAFAQNDLGLNPPRLKWDQINTSTGKIIFPRGLDSTAFRVAGIMDYQRIHDSSILATGAMKRVPVILQNQSVLPAGFSTPAPWRNEYYLTSPQNFFLGPVPWVDALTIHEYRHTQQFYAGNKGFTLPFKIVMGQTGWLIYTLFTQPLWLREGDAVTAETIFTGGGRGRLPSFHMEYRALRMEGYRFSYEKAHFTSFKHIVPNPYRTGYYMITKARRDFGDDIWQKILFDTYHKAGYGYPLSRMMQKHTGKGIRQFYDATVLELDSIFRHTESGLQLTPSHDVVKVNPRIPTHWNFPHYLPDGSIVGQKSAFDEIKTYYRIDADGKETKLFSPGIYTEDHETLVLEGNLMTWCESSFDERWINLDYSIIKLYDFRTGKIRKLTSRTRFFSPAPSRDGTKVAAVELNELNQCSIHILDAETGTVLRTLPRTSDRLYSQLRWGSQDEFIVGLALDDTGNSIVILDPVNGSVLHSHAFRDISVSRPFHANDLIYYNGGHTGIDNIYAWNYKTDRIFQITSSRFGAFKPVISPDGKKLIYAEYTAGGHRLREVQLDSTLFREIKGEIPSDIKFHESLVKAEGINLSKLGFSGKYEVRKYRALTDGLFNVYGWLPLPNVPQYGAEFYTQNIMSTLRGTIGLLYNTNEDNLHSYAKLTYAALYPVIELQYEYGLDRKSRLFDSLDAGIHEVEVTENFFTGGLNFPFRLTQGNHNTFLRIGGFYQYFDAESEDTIGATDELTNTTFDGAKLELQFSRLQVQSRRHVKPRWGQIFNATYQKAFDDVPEKRFTSLQLFFPGLVRTHSLNFISSYKHESVTASYRYADDFLMPRGYEPFPFESQYSVYANYEFPLWYPDIGAGPVAFFQRLRMNVFYDFLQGEVLDEESLLNSAGAELITDFRFLRLFQVAMGVRYSYTFTDEFERTAPVQFFVSRFELVN